MNKILITGAHRSGTTFLGNILSASEGTNYIYEPLNNKVGLKAIQDWFPYITKNNEIFYINLYRKLIKGNVTFKRLPPSSNIPLQNNLGRLLFGNRSNLVMIKMKLFKKKNIIIKDPFACFISEWLHQTFNFNVVVMVRHPAGFIASLKRMGWTFDFSNLFEKKDLLNNYLYDVLPKKITVEDLNNMSIVEQGVYLWKIIYYVLYIYGERNPDFIFIKHEDLSINPISESEKIYSSLNLSFNDTVKDRVNNLTQGNDIDPEDRRVHILKRNSQNVAKNWKENLSEKEVQFIKENTFDVWKLYYDERDW